MATSLAPFFTTYYLQIVSAVVCFALGLIVNTLTVRRVEVKAVKRRDSAVDVNQLSPPPGPDPDHENAPHVPYSPPRYDEDEMLRRSAKFYLEMSARRSVRDISDKSVPLAVIEDCIRTAGTSPSGAHMQPWTFAVISNPDMKLAVRHIIEEEERINYEKRMSSQWLYDLKKIGTTWRKPYLNRAPYVIIVFKQHFGVTDEGERKTHYYQEISASIATGFLLAALHNAGLVTVTTTPMNAGPRLRELLERPIGEKVLVLLPVGFPTEDAKVPDLGRKSLEEIMVLKD